MAELFNMTREELVDTINELRDENETNEIRIVELQDLVKNQEIMILNLKAEVGY